MKKQHRLNRRTSSLAALIVIVTTCASAQQQPTLSFTCDTADFIRALHYSSPSAPQSLRDFLGLLIEENKIIENYPLTTSLFFDAESADISSRYNIYTNPQQAATFDESKIPGGTLQKYGHVLNIIGYRLRQYPDKTISIVGCNSRERELDETRELSKQRAQNVYDYLVDIWQIDPARITMLPPRDLPKHPSNTNDPKGDEENRRVEIITNDWGMGKIITQRELRRYPQPDSLRFHMSNGVDDAEVARREIVITRGDWPWHVMTDIGTTTPTMSYNWGRLGNEDLIPEDEAPYVARLVVYTVDGRKLMSNSVAVPVKIYTRSYRHNCWTSKDIRRYSIILFPFDNARLNGINERALREYIYPTLRTGSRVQVTGYTDIIGSPSHNQRLSEQRANAVVRDTRKQVKKSVLASLDGKGVGEEAPLYSNDLPEGRFYNRTVQIVIENPADEYLH